MEGQNAAKKFSLTPILSEFVENYKYYGFKDKGALVQTALFQYKQELEQERLMKSADLYAQIYEEDEELRNLTETAAKDWPKFLFCKKEMSEEFNLRFPGSQYSPS